MSESEDGKWGIAHVYASFNNTLITVTDETGAETIAKSSGGTVVKQNRDEASPYAAMQMAEVVAERVKDAGLEGVHVRVVPRQPQQVHRSRSRCAGDDPRALACGRRDRSDRRRHAHPARRDEGAKEQASLT